LDAGEGAGSVGGEPWCLVNIGVAVVVEAVERRRRGMRVSIVGWWLVVWTGQRWMVGCGVHTYELRHPPVTSIFGMELSQITESILHLLCFLYTGLHMYLFNGYCIDLSLEANGSSCQVDVPASLTRLASRVRKLS
jgi:hypothetical protein